MTFFNKFSRFHKWYFIVFLILNCFVFLIPAIENKDISSSMTTIGILALISTVTGMLSAIYTARGQAINYLWGIANTFTYIFVAWASQAYGQSILYILFETPMQFVGYYLWSKNARLNNSETVEVKKLKSKEWIFLIVLFLAVWGAYSVFLYELPTILKSLFNINILADKTFIIDALSSTLTITAVILTSKRYFEQWHFWIASGAVGMILFMVSMLGEKNFSLDSLSALIMWSQFLISSVYGFINWKRL